MSDNTFDVRTKLCERDHKVLTAVAQATGRDMAEIVRVLGLTAWADAEIHRANSVTSILRGCEGSAGSAGE